MMYPQNLVWTGIGQAVEIPQIREAYFQLTEDQRVLGQVKWWNYLRSEKHTLNWL